MAKDKLYVLLLLLLSPGCASKHAYMSKPQSLGPEQWQCDSANNCELVRMWQPSQLTSAGCLAHAIVTGGHIAWECRKPKNGKLPEGGRWIWGMIEKIKNVFVYYAVEINSASRVPALRTQ